MIKYIFLFVFLFCIYIFYEGLKKDPREIPSSLISQETPPISIIGYEGIKFTQADLKKGEIKILNFFASWCPPCKIEHKQILELSRKYAVYGIAKKNKLEDLNIWLNELGNPYKKIGMDYDGLVSIDWGVYGLPETFIIDKDGIIKYRHLGPIMQRDIEDFAEIISKIK